MTYDELIEIIGRGNPDEWISEEAFLIHKGDLNLRIEMVDRERSDTGDGFHEDWTEGLGGHPPKRQVFWIYYGSTRVMEIHTVVIDQRTIVPLPDSDDHSSMDPWHYAFGKIVERYRAAYGGIYSLDSVLRRAGISVRD